MQARNRRHFTLLDGIICVAGIAVGIWVGTMMLTVWTKVFFSIPEDVWRANRTRLAWHWGTLMLRHTQATVAVLTLVVLVLRILGPRPYLRRLTRQPGFNASFAATLAICFGGALNYATSKSTFNPGHVAQGYTWTFFFPNGSEPGLAVASCWTVLLMGRRWRFERSWIDCLGCLVGVYWIIMIVVARMAPLL